LSVRAALYYAPALTDPLWAAGCAWLGRDPETAASLPLPPDRAAITAEPRVYGFHATLKPPMRLRGTWDHLVDAADALAARIAPFDLPPLAVANLSGFLALRETQPCPPLHALADACVEAADAFRIPPDEAELARRRGQGLPPLQEAMLLRWGYPHVLAAWRFHMTLTRRLSDAERPGWQAAAEAHFAAALAMPRRAADICVFAQPGPGQPFTLAERLTLRG
jgi:hypothetical protein